MNIELHEFQLKAVRKLLYELKEARREFELEGMRQALALSAPTGSGKTVIMSALIEAVLDRGHPYGESGEFPDDQASFLWITDQPQLNAQTIDRMLRHFDRIWFDGIEEIKESFDREQLEPRKLYFVNTQKLGKKGLLVKQGDGRQHLFWETMSNTVEDRPSSVYVVIDEAHRGMAETRKQKSEAKEAGSIVQKFIMGDPGVGMPKVPIIIGVRATPKRFEELIADTDRRARLVRVKPKEALQSGLLKESILLRHSLTPIDNEMTLLGSAARRFLMFEKAWRAHHQRSGGPLIEPIMLVQVEDASETDKKQGRYSATDLAEARRVISDVFGGVPASNVFAHAFQDAKTLNVNGTDLRGLAPADINYDAKVKVVFFKTALNTGWDCPRAEVMMSFRAAKDVTNITQLVGRMVRTPLRQRVEGPERGLLNAVDLYLPKYEEKGLDAVVRHLTDEDQETHTPSKVIPVVDLSLNRRLPEAEECRALLGCLPTFRLDRRRRTSETARFMKIAGRLQVEDATEKARGALTRWLEARLEEKRSGAPFREALKRQDQVEVGARRLAVSEMLAGPEAGSVGSAGPDSLHLDEASEFEEVADRDLISRIDRADRELGWGLARALVKDRESVIEAENSGADNGAYRSAMLEVLALLKSDSDLKRDLNRRAGELIDEWKQRHAPDIEALSKGERKDLEMLISPAVESAQPVEPTPPPEMIARRRGKSAQRWDKHLYAEADGGYFTYLNGWERAVLDEELERPEVVAWFRNQLGADQWRLAVPYYKGEDAHLMYPDLIVFRQSKDEGLVADILDPHWLKDDAAAKVKGLADYAEKHPDAPLGRVEAIAVIDKHIRRLDLSEEQNRSAVRACNTSLEVRACLEGMNLTPGREAEQEPSELRQDSGDELEHESVME